MNMMFATRRGDRREGGGGRGEKRWEEGGEKRWEEGEEKRWEEEGGEKRWEEERRERGRRRGVYTCEKKRIWIELKSHLVGIPLKEHPGTIDAFFRTVRAVISRKCR